MGVVLIKGGGGSSADLDVITATAADILAGKVGLDKEGNPIKPLYPPLYQPVNQGSLTITQGR